MAEDGRLTQVEIEALMARIRSGDSHVEEVADKTGGTPAEGETTSEVHHMPPGPPLEPKAKDESPTGDMLPGILDLPVTLAVKMAKGVRPVGDVLQFLPGTVVEMDDPVSTLAEVSVNGHLLARGEVVTVGGFYGVLIKEIVSPRERLKGIARQN